MFSVAERLLFALSAGQPHLQADVGFAKGFLAARVRNDDKKIVKLWKQFAPIQLPR